MPIDSTTRPDHDGPLTVRGPQELLHVVPYLIGFHPCESLVVVGMRDSRVLITARVDLADLQSDADLARLLTAVVRAEARDVLAIVYTEGPVVEASALPQSSIVAGFGDLAEQLYLTFVDGLLVSGGRWWSYCCTDDRCCASQGQQLDEAATSAAVAAATFAGLVALPDREALAAQLEPAPLTEREALRPALTAEGSRAFEAVLEDQGQRRQRSLIRGLFKTARAADAGQLSLADADVARFAVALTEQAVRDSVWVAIDDRRIDGRELWRSLARRVPPPYDAVPLFLVGWIAWREGNGALAAIAARRAVDSDPGCTPADLLLAAVSEAIDPRRLPRIRPARLRAPRLSGDSAVLP